MKKKTVYGELYLESQGFGDEWRGDSIKSFGNTAFRRCKSLNSITFQGTMAQ